MHPNLPAGVTRDQASSSLRLPRAAWASRAGITCCLLIAAPICALAQTAPDPAVPFFVANGSTASQAGAYAEGDEAVAAGEASSATGLGAIALGAGSNATADNALAVGRNTLVTQERGVAVGVEAASNAGFATALGAQAQADATARWGTALGYRSTVAGVGATAAGTFSRATNLFSTAFGYGAQSFADAALALGPVAQANATRSVALGAGAVADRESTVSVGNTGSERQITNVAAGTQATDAVNVAQLGAQLDAATVAFRAGGSEVAVASAPASTAAGNASQALGEGSTSIGAGARADTTRATALGRDAVASAADAVAVGAGSRAERDGVVSFGSGDGVGGPAVRQLVNVAEGQVQAGSRDAVNGGQLYTAMNQAISVLGGGAALGPQGAVLAPTYWVQGQSFTNVGDALGTLDRRVGELSARSQGPQNVLGEGARAATADAVAVGRQAAADGAGSTALGADSRVDAGAASAVALGQGSVADRANTVSVGRAGRERQVTNVAAGTQDTDAVNKAQLDNGVARANAYTDQRYAGMADTLKSYQGEVDDRFRRQDRRIDQQGAMNAAMLNMATSAAGIRTQNRVGVGVGFQGGESALSVGYQRAISERATVTLGGAFGRSASAVGFGAGFGW
ncbi:MAG TPA: YadA-like family protein [Stenotrophomonas sp.]|nr:YadA-like family protein [Stenotrophomonas sp.]